MQFYTFCQTKKTAIMSIKIVQFLHSGQEYKRSEFKEGGEETIKPWNTGDHRRKFLHAKGAYIDAGKIIGNKNNWKDIYFWGEWEPDSIVTKIQTKVKGHCPHYIHEPFVEINYGKLKIPENIPIEDEDDSLKKYSIAKNTDPFVFGDKGFFYSCCKQRSKKGNKTQLQDLEPGSIILFGSNINHKKKSNLNINQDEESEPYFALDTVFVVGPEKQPFSIYSYSDELGSFPPEHYCDIMNFEGWKDSLNSTGNGIESTGCSGSNCTSNKSESEGCEKGSHFTCYRGASIGHTVNGMYSFVPCKLKLEDEKGFERVKLSDQDFPFISNNLSQGVKYTESNRKMNIAIWEKLCNFIETNGFKKAVNLNYKQEITPKSIEAQK